MFKKFIKRNFLIYAGMYTIIILTLKAILNILNIEFMSWVYFISFNIVYISIIIGINQIIFKIHKKTALKVILVLITLVIFCITGIISIIGHAFAYRSTYIIKEDNKKMVVILDGWSHFNLYYYNYINPFMRSKNYIKEECVDDMNSFENNDKYKQSLTYIILENYLDCLENIYWFIYRK